MENKVDVTIEDDTCIFSFSSDLMTEVAMEFRRVYVKQNKSKKYTLDFKRVRKIDSTGFGMLLDMRKTLNPEEKIKIINTSDAVKSLLKDLELDKFFMVD